ncbi:MAG: hypothetical protein II309_06205, partial [Bacilli bacterium]|nr:hypothetical protein [Bacilli bacterium]
MIKNSLSWINLNASVGGGTGGTSDYNQLSNRPIKTLIGTVQNPIKLWKLETGLFILNGFIQHTNELVSEGKSLFVSVVAGLSNGKYVVAAFIPFWEGQYEYILNSLSSNNYNEHQIVMMISQDDVLTLDNEKEYTPTKDYHPSTKKYVDDMIVNFREELSEMGVNEENIESLIAENRRRDIAIQALLSQGGGSKTVTIEEETHTISLDYSIDKGMATINTMEGSTLVNVATQKEKVGLSYGQDNAVNYSNEILTEQNTNVKPMLEGNTMVNYCNNGNISMGLNKEINVVDDTGKMITLDDTADSGLVDVKIEGKTLVNIFNFDKISWDVGTTFENGVITLTNPSNGWSTFDTELSTIKPNTQYTLIVNLIENTTNELIYINNKDETNGYFKNFSWKGKNDLGVSSYLVTTVDDITNRKYSVRTKTKTEGQYVKLQIMLLEGDHTDKDLSYFEGLKSVGQDTDEISVSSTNQLWNNFKLFKPASDFDITINKLYSNGFNINANAYNGNSALYYNTYLKKNETYTIELKGIANIGNVRLYPNLTDMKNNINQVGVVNGIDKTDYVVSFTPTHDNMLLRFWVGDSANKNAKVESISIYKENQHIPHQSNKKQILYYNPTTQTWEKPILREWDSIEKHSDGKYYYHKRSGEVVLNGSETWNNSSVASTDTVRFVTSLSDNKHNVAPICDIFKGQLYTTDDVEGAFIGGSTNLGISILRTKLSTQDVAGFKTWLQANPVTVVYQLTKEEIYECTNLSLNTYSNQTNIFNNSLIPCNMEIKNSTYDCILFPNTKYTVKLDSNISNDIQVNLGGTVSTINTNIFEITT